MTWQTGRWPAESHAGRKSASPICVRIWRGVRPVGGSAHLDEKSAFRPCGPDGAFNPHTETALAAYCKSPYPQCSAPNVLSSVNFYPRSTVDTALQIYP